MTSASILELTLRDILNVVNPLREDWLTRYQIIEELRAVVQSVQSLGGANVEPFGSFASNLFTRWGDLDLSIELHNGSNISSIEKKKKQTLLREVLRALRRRGGWHKLQYIGYARVPILKLEKNISMISCDISINNLTGQMKSKLLFWINEIDGRFRDMVLLIKEWAKANYINDPKTGSLNSYTLSLLIIFHFQTCIPAILPPLIEVYPGNIADDLTGIRAVAERRIEETVSANINRFRSDRPREINQSSLSDLFISFLAKFSDISSRASEQGICLQTGRWENINGHPRWPPKPYALYVEDPFEQPDNCARSVNQTQLARISDAFKSTHRVLISSNQNRSSLIAALVRPQISQLCSRTPQPHSGGYVGAPQIQRTTQTPSHLQYQTKNTTGNWHHHSAMNIHEPRINRRIQTPQMQRTAQTPTSQLQYQSQNTTGNWHHHNAMNIHEPHMHATVQKPWQVQHQFPDRRGNLYHNAMEMHGSQIHGTVQTPSQVRNHSQDTRGNWRQSTRNMHGRGATPRVPGQQVEVRRQSYDV